VPDHVLGDRRLGELGAGFVGEPREQRWSDECRVVPSPEEGLAARERVAVPVPATLRPKHR
jgi:hypothetical protein